MNNSTECPEAIKNVNITDSNCVIIVLGVACTILAVYITAANLVIITALHRQRAPSAQRPGSGGGGGGSSPPCHLLMVSMSVSDAIIGVVSMPLAIYVIANNGRWELGKVACSAWLWLDKVLCTTSIYHVAFMALDRYFAVCRPLMYRVMSKKTTLVLIALSWAVPLVVSTVFMAGGWQHSEVTWLFVCLEQAGTCTPVYNRPYLVTVSTLDFYVPFLVIFVLYFLVARQIYKLGRTSVSHAIMSKISIVKTKSVAKFIRISKKKSFARQLKENEHLEEDTLSELKSVDSVAVGTDSSTRRLLVRYASDAAPLEDVTRETPGNNSARLDQTGSYIGGSDASELALNPYTLHVLLAGDQDIEDKDATLHIRYSNMFSRNSQYDMSGDSVFILNTLNVGDTDIAQSGVDTNIAQSVEDADIIQKSENTNIVQSVEDVDIAQSVEDTDNAQSVVDKNIVQSGEDTVIARKKGESCAYSVEKSTQICDSIVSEISSLRPDSFSTENAKMERNNKTRTGCKSYSYAVEDEDVGSAPPTSHGPKASPTKPTNKARHNTNKAFTTIGCIVICFTVCWLPFSIYNFVLIYNGFEMASWPSLLFVWMGYANSALNPVFYCFTDSVRQAVLAQMKWVKIWR